MTALIITFPTDAHAVAAQWGLLRSGVACDLFSFADVPGRSLVSYDPVADTFSLGGPQVAGGGYSVVWNRRALFGPRPAFVHPADWPQVQRDQRRLHDDVTLVGAPHAAWINPEPARRRALSKAWQLRLAAELGFEAPPTLISNDPAAVRAFVARVGDAIVKPLGPMAWARDDAGRSEMTTAPVTAADLGHDDAIRACRMIYQARIDKAVEYRVTIFGSEVVCAEIRSQALKAARLDWRRVPTARLDLAEVPCPPDLAARLLRFMRAAGLLFGAFDLARTPDGRIVFFEVNEQGQFLWLENSNPEIRLLDRLVRFLADPRETFTWRPAAQPLALADAQASDHFRTAMAEAERRHDPVDWGVATAE